LLSTICGIFHIRSFQYVVWFINFATEPTSTSCYPWIQVILWSLFDVVISIIKRFFFKLIHQKPRVLLFDRLQEFSHFLVIELDYGGLLSGGEIIPATMHHSLRLTPHYLGLLNYRRCCWRWLDGPDLSWEEHLGNLRASLRHTDRNFISSRFSETLDSAVYINHWVFLQTWAYDKNPHLREVGSQPLTQIAGMG
jgi:hypothetical protein